MFDIGWSELLLIGIVALIVVGPEDLPKLFHTLGRITSKARMMAREFSSAMEDAAKSSGLDEAGQALKDVNKLTSKRALGLDALDRAADRFEKWDPVNPLQEARRAKPVPEPAAPVPPVAGIAQESGLDLAAWAEFDVMAGASAQMELRVSSVSDFYLTR